METIAVFEAKSRLSEILAAVEQGEEFTVTKRGTPIARIIPYHQAEFDEAARQARRAQIARCVAARQGTAMSDFNARAATEDGRD